MDNKVIELCDSVAEFIKNSVDREEHISELGIIHDDFLKMLNSLNMLRPEKWIEDLLQQSNKQNELINNLTIN